MSAQALAKVEEIIAVLDDIASGGNAAAKASAAAYRQALTLLWEHGGITQEEAADWVGRWLETP